MTTENSGGLAFPRPSVFSSQPALLECGAVGMSLRDWFAGQAIIGILAPIDGEPNAIICAKWAYKIADAMISEKENLNK